LASPRIGVVGATGAVGTVTLELLAERGYTGVRAFASARSAGRRLGDLVVEEATPKVFAAGDVDLWLFSVGTSASRELVPEAVAGGAVCIDKSAAFRLTEGVPLVVPEVNGERAAEHEGIVANPNCCTIPLTCVLKPLHDAAGLRRVRVATYQAVSGAGAQRMEQLRSTPAGEQDLGVADSSWSFDGEEFDEESKLRGETRKILELPDLPISATCVRVPVLGGVDRDGGAARGRARTRAARRGAQRADRGVPHSGHGRGPRRSARRPDPRGQVGRERPRPLRRLRQPPERRSAERDPDRRAPARAPSAGRLSEDVPIGGVRRAVRTVRS